MTYKTITTDQIEVLVSGFFTTHHLLRTEIERIGKITLKGMRPQGIYQSFDGQVLELEKTSWWKNTHEIREGGAVLGTALLRGFFRQEFDIDFGGQTYILKSTKFGGRTWQLSDSGGSLLLEIRHRGAFRRGAYLTIRSEIDFPLMLFAYHLVNSRWQEQQAAAAA